MNQSQLKYARERAKKLYDKRVKDLTAAHTTEAVPMSDDDKLKALKAGAFRIVPAKDRPENGWRSSWANNVIFPGEVKGGLNTKTFAPAKDQLDKDYTALLDELVLGDNEQALALLRAFEAA